MRVMNESFVLLYHRPQITNTITFLACELEFALHEGHATMLGEGQSRGRGSG